MAYDKDKIFEEILVVIEAHKIKHFSYLQAYVEPETSTLYLLFPKESEQFNTIKRALKDNKITSRQAMLKKWEDSENATLQIAAFKMIASKKERKALSTNWNNNDHTTQGEKINNKITIEFVDGSIKDL